MIRMLLSFVTAQMGERPCLELAIHGMLKNSGHLSYNIMRKEKGNDFNFGHNEKPDPQSAFDFEQPCGESIDSDATAPTVEGGATPTSPLQPSKLIRAVNACDPEHNEIRVPAHPYSSVCVCEVCELTRDSVFVELPFGKPEEVVYGTYNAKQLRFDRITETEARSFIVPRNYLRRWFVGATLCFGAFSPERHLVAACVLSSPAAHSKRFTSRNAKEIRRFVMLDCCGRNSESRFLSWILRETKKLCPHLRFIFTFGNPKYDKETPYRAAGFRFDGTVSCDAQWISHKTHKSREAPEDKHRYVYTY